MSIYFFIGIIIGLVLCDINSKHVVRGSRDSQRIAYTDLNKVYSIEYLTRNKDETDMDYKKRVQKKYRIGE